ncbi:unnamed protein product, partial [Tilletia laevis]
HGHGSTAEDEAAPETDEVPAFSEFLFLSLGHLIRSVEIQSNQIGSVWNLDTVANKMETPVRMHFVVLIENGGCLYTCSYPLAMGFPCAHMLAAVAEGMPYSLGNIKKRWYTDLTACDGAQGRKCITVPQPRLILAAPKAPLTEPPAIVARHQNEPVSTNYSKQYVFSEASAHLKMTAEFVNNPGDLAELLQVMARYREEKAKRTMPAIRDPLPVVKIGRPQSRRLRGAAERKKGGKVAKVPAKAKEKEAGSGPKLLDGEGTSPKRKQQQEGKRARPLPPSGRPSKARRTEKK